MTVEFDEAGNLWATLIGRSAQSLVIGSHLDSVPNGGWLDGCLGVVAGLEVLRAFAAGPTPALTVRLVDWADEEGARFGRSLFGSSAAAGLLDPESVRQLTDGDGVALPAALSENGVALEEAPRAVRSLREAQPTSSYTSSRVRCWRTRVSLWGSSAEYLASSAIACATKGSRHTLDRPRCGFGMIPWCPRRS